MKIRKAVIPAAGYGTRVLPLTKSMPKEMIPIIDKPAIQYIVEEAVNSGIEDILIIVSRGKMTVEDHFDRNPELEKKLSDTQKLNELDEIVKISKMANIMFVRQQEARGLGHAILQAKTFVGNEPFAVLYGDDVIFSEVPACAQLCNAYEKYNMGTLGIKKVSHNDIKKYSSLNVSQLSDRIYSVTDMIEKPDEEHVMSDYSILGRCILPPEIFEILENTKPGFGGEIQLTDAMKVLATTKGMIGIDYDGIRYDMGNKFEILKANIEVALKSSEFSDQLKQYLKTIANT